MSGTVYGLRVTGLDGAASLMQPEDPALPELTVRRGVTVRRSLRDELDERTAQFGLQGGCGRVELTRAPLTARLQLDRPYDDELVLHPFLAMTAAISGWWLGRTVLHAGAFVIDGGAWGVLGRKGAGKSSLLAQLAGNGLGVMCDDVLVVENGVAHAGPSCIDLRPQAAERFGGEPLGVVGARERIRLRLPLTAAAVPLRGWVVPEWGEELEVTAAPVASRLPHVLGNLALYRGVPEPQTALALAALPLLLWRRPRSWSAMPEAASELLRAVRSRRQPSPSAPGSNALS